MTFTKMHNECWDLHYTLSAALTLAFALYVNVLVAVCVVFAIGLLKELFDKHILKRKFGVGDFIADILGIISGAVVALIAYAIKG